MDKSLIAILCVLALSSCSISQRKISEAYVNKAVAEYKVTLPDLPDFCFNPLFGVTPKVGEKWRWVDYRYRVVIENANNEKLACKQWYDSLKKSYEKKET